MTTLSDTLIIDNTHFEVDETERLICYTNLPDGTRFAQAVSSKEAVQKNMIGWCNTVREFLRAKERDEEDEKIAARIRRQAESPLEDAGTVATPTTTASVTPSDPKEAVLAWYEDTQAQIDDLSETIHNAMDRRDRLRDERDRIKPIIDAWKGVKGES